MTKKLFVSVLSLSLLLGLFAVSSPAKALSPIPYNYEYVSQSSYPSSLVAGEVTSVWIKIKNTGSLTWYGSGNSNIVRLGAGSKYGNENQQRDYHSEFYDSENWLSDNRPVAISPTQVASGETGTFTFNIKAPSSAGIYKAYFAPVADGFGWMKDIGMYWQITVLSNNDSTCKFEGESLGAVVPGNNVQCCVGLVPYVPDGVVGTRGTCQKPGYNGGSSKLSDYMFQYMGQTENVTLDSGDVKSAIVTFKNIGSSAWNRAGNYPLRLGTSNPKDRSSKLKAVHPDIPLCVSSAPISCLGSYSEWLGSNRVTMNQDNVSPGNNGTFTIQFENDQNLAAGKYKEYFQLVVDGLGWLTDIGVYTEVTVVGSTPSSDNQSGSNQQSGSNITVTSLSITPATTTSVKSGNIYDFVVKANYSDGSVQDVTTIASWEVIDGTGNGTMHTGIPGRFIAGSFGSCYVKATFSGKSVTSALINVMSL